MTFCEFSITCVQDRASRFGKGDVGCVVGRKVMPQFPDAAQQWCVFVPFRWKQLQSLNELLRTVRINTLVRCQAPERAHSLYIE